MEIFIFNQWPACTVWKWLAYKNSLIRLQLKMLMNLLGSTMDRNPPANARDMGLIPDPERFHMPWSNEDQAPHLLKPVHLKPMLSNKRSPCSEKPVQRS